ncbi:MAG: hypothetical protein ACOYT8_05225 [Candidatus Dependentiae bacterium]
MNKKLLYVFLVAFLFDHGSISSAEKNSKLIFNTPLSNRLKKDFFLQATQKKSWEKSCEHIYNKYSNNKKDISPLGVGLDVTNQISFNSQHANKSQTDAYLSVISFNKSLFWPIIERCNMQLLIKKMIEQERIMAKTHYVFYHGQNNTFILLQDILKEFAQLNSQHTTNENFEFLRSPFSSLSGTTVQDFLKETLEKYPCSNYDKKPDISCHLISANLSIFGNETRNGENSLFYFLTNYSSSLNDLKKIITELFIKLNIDQNHVDKVINTYKPLFNKSNYGLMQQIFIPKNLVDSCVYLSEPFGIPYKEQIDKNTFDTVKRMHTKISSILELYQKEPEALNKSTWYKWFTLSESHLMKMQARILMTKDIMLNPNSGVKIYRHHKFDVEVYNQCKAELRKIINLIRS